MKNKARPANKKAFDIHKNLPDPMRVRPVDLKASQPPPKKIKRPLWLRALVTLLLLTLTLAIFIGTWDAINISRASTKIFGSGNLLSLLDETTAKNTDGRTNILLVGYSIDDPGHPAADLTDSIMLLSLKKQSKSGYMLSVPRDLYVDIPGNGRAKINEAYKTGGMDLLRQIVEEIFGVPIHYYALLNYAAVRDTVNALGGITIDIKSSDPRGLYDPNISPVDGGPLKLANGPQKLDGQTALNLTRARGDAYGSYGFPQADFDRTQNQRQVLVAIKEKLSWKLILNPLQNGKIFQAAANNTKTDVKLGEARSLFSTFNSVPTDKLQSISLRNINGKNLLASYVAPNGQSALIPASGIGNYLAIQTSVEVLNQQ